MPRLRGLRNFILKFAVRLVVRSGLTVLPLAMVILLCCLMMGFRGKAPQFKASFPAPPSAVQAALAPPAEAAVRSEVSRASASLAAFERLHITHARLNVPSD